VSTLKVFLSWLFIALVMAAPAFAHGWGRQAVVVQRQRVVVQRVIAPRQRVVVQQFAQPYVQQFAVPYVQQFAAPVYSQQFVQPYVQQFNGGCHSGVQQLQGGCQQLFR